MVSYRKIVLVNLCVFITLTIYSQGNSDIGVLFSSEHGKTLISEYRKVLSEKKLLKFGASIGGNFSPEFIPLPTNFTIDTVLNKGYWFEKNLITTIKTGFEYKIRSSVFSIGTDIILGHHATNVTVYDDIYIVVDPNRQIKLNEFQINASEPVLPQTTRHYITPGVQLSLSMNLPINDSFLFSMNAVSNLKMYYYLTSSNKIGPLGELKTIGSNFITSNTSLNIGIRYKLGLNKS